MTRRSNSENTNNIVNAIFDALLSDDQMGTDGNTRCLASQCCSRHSASPALSKSHYWSSSILCTSCFSGHYNVLPCVNKKYTSIAKKIAMMTNTMTTSGFFLINPALSSSVSVFSICLGLSMSHAASEYQGLYDENEQNCSVIAFGGKSLRRILMVIRN